MALPLAGNLYGDLGLALASVAMVAMTPVLNVLVRVRCWCATPRPARPTGAVSRWRSCAIRFIWACVVGPRSIRSPRAIPQPVHAFVDALGRSSLALGLLIVGAGLRIERIDPAERRRCFVACALKLIVMPAIAVTIACGFGLSGANLAVVACCTAVPAASNSYILARQMGGDAPLMAQILTFETVLAAVTMPVVLGLVS